MRGALLAVFLGVTMGTQAFAAPFQWSAAAGGNDHVYDWIPGYLTWTNASTAATAQTFAGFQGYLATVSTAPENNFFQVALQPGRQRTNSDRLAGRISGHQRSGFLRASGGWRWVSGDPWTFTSWWTLHGFPDEFQNKSQNFLRTQPVGPDVFWDDIENNPGGSFISGYFVEYPVPSQAAWRLLRSVVCSREGDADST